MELQLNADAGITQSLQFLAIPRKGLCIENFLTRLHTRPVNAHPVNSYAELPQKFGIRFPMRPVLCADGRRGVVTDLAKSPPIDPGAFHLAAFPLRSGTGNTEFHRIFERKIVHESPLLLSCVYDSIIEEKPQLVNRTKASRHQVGI